MNTCSSEEHYLDTDLNIGYPVVDLIPGEGAILARLRELEKALGILFNDRSLLEQALVHTSYLNENPGFALISNERLEFLGDAVLGMVVAEKLYDAYPMFSEGEMTRLRAAVVRRETLARVARVVKLNGYLYLGKGEEASGGRDKGVNLAGAIEAVIAAVFIDQGLEPAKKFVLRLFDEEIQKAITHKTEVDYKSKLQELTQAMLQQTPVYRVVEAEGPDHERTFTVEVKAGGKVLGSGSGKSKKLAETDAARVAVRLLMSRAG